MANLIRRRRDEREGGQLARGVDVGRWDPLDIMTSLLRWDPFREMNAVAPLIQQNFMPNVEVRETNDAYLLQLDLPGVPADEVDISVAGNRITVSGRREQEEVREDDRYYAVERAYGTFTRSFTLPEGVDADAVTAELQDGVLTVRIPKKPEVQPKRIPIGGERSEAAQLQAQPGQERRSTEAQERKSTEAQERKSTEAQERKPTEKAA